MTHVASQILGTRNAPYGAAFSFVSEVVMDLQVSFVSKMDLAKDKVQGALKHLQFLLALAAQILNTPRGFRPDKT